MRVAALRTVSSVLDVVAHPRQVADDQRALGLARATAATWWAMSAVVDLERVVVAEDDHGQRVADEDEVDAGLVRDAGARARRRR